MVRLQEFTNLTFKQEDLLSKHYCFGSLSMLTLRVSQDGLTFHTRVAKKSSLLATQGLLTAA